MMWLRRMWRGGNLLGLLLCTGFAGFLWCAEEATEEAGAAVAGEEEKSETAEKKMAENAEGENKPAEVVELAPPTEEVLPDNAWKIPEQEAYPPSEFRGNWFKKRAVVQQARTLYEAIHQFVIEKWDVQYHEFVEVYEDVRNQLSKRLESIELTEDDVRTVIEKLGGDPAQRVPEYTALHLQNTLSKEIIQDHLQKLLDTFGMIRDIDGKLREVIEAIKKQEPLGTAMEKEAWQQYESIDAAYDDRIAAKLYDDMSDTFQYAQQLLGPYLQGEIVPYAQKLVLQLDEKLAVIQSLHDELFKNGIRLRKKDREQLALAAHEAKKVEKQGWLAWLWSMLVAPFVWLWEKISSLWQK